MVTWVRLGDACRQARQLIDPHSKDAALPYLSLEHIEAGTGKVLKRPSGMVEDEGRSTTFAFDKRHVLYGKLRPYLNKVALPDFEGRCTTELIPLLPENGVDREYLGWVLRREETVAAAMQGKTGSRMPRADLEGLFELSIPLPPLPEQQRIAAWLKAQLAEVEVARAAVSIAFNASAQLSATILQEPFDGMTVDHRLGDALVDIQAGKSLQTLERKAKLDEPGILKVSAASWEKFDPDEAKAIEPHQCAPIWSVRAGDFIISRANTLELVGAVVIAKEDHPLRFLSDKLLRLVFRSGLINPEFMLLQLRGKIARAYIQANATGTSHSMRNIGQSVIRNIPVWIPPLSRQERIATQLKSKLVEVDATRIAIQAQLKTIKNLPQRLLAETFSNL